MLSPTTAGEGPGRLPALLARRGALLAGLLAAAASLPALALPFLSDDWALLEATSSTVPSTTPYRDFRPLFMASFLIDRGLYGLSPALFHLTNLLLIAAASGLVVIAARRVTGDAPLAAGAGLLFAVHPYHVENAAWIAARSDALFAVPYLLAVIAWERWRRTAQGLPLTAIVLFAAALLAKETAVTLPALLALAALLRRAPRREWMRGLLPLAALALAHFLLLRPWAVGGAGRTPGAGFGAGWIENALAFGAAMVVPVPSERMIEQPLLWGSLAALAGGGLLVAALVRSGSIPRLALSAAAAFAVLLGPYVMNFQERYLFLPAAAGCLALACLLREARGRIAMGLCALLVAVWAACAVTQWSGWREAAAASRSLVEGLVEAGRDPATEEIVVANMPFRVRGGSVAGDFRAALAVSGARPLPVRAACWISLPSRDHDGLDGPPERAVTRHPGGYEVRLRVERGAFSRFVGPAPGEGDGAPGAAAGGLRVLADGRAGRGVLRVRVEERPGRSVLLWTGGRLAPPPATPE